MKKLASSCSILLSLTFVVSSAAQDFSIRPHFGYYLPRMNDVNDRIEKQIEGWRDLLGETVPSPGEIDGNRAFGAQMQYQVDGNTFVNVNVSYYQEEVQSEYVDNTGATPNRFNYVREVKLYDVMLNLRYYLDYGPWTRVNVYFGAGAGLIFAKARSVTVSTFTSNPSTGLLLSPTDTHGDFSGNALSAVASAGFDFRLTQSVALWAEAGLQYGNIGQLEGTVSRINGQPDPDAVTDSSFDFTGFYVRGGLGIGLPL